MSGFAISAASPQTRDLPGPVGISEPVGFWDSVKAGWDDQTKTRNLGVRQEAWRMSLWSRHQEAERLSGHKLAPSYEMLAPAMGTELNGSVQPLGALTDQEYEAQLAKISGLDTLATTRSKLDARLNAIRAKSQGDNLNPVGEFVGATAGSLADPVNLIGTVLTGGWGAGRSLATRVLMQGAANAGIEVAEVPGRMVDAQVAGPKYHLSEAAGDVTGAAVAGGAFEVVGDGLSHVARRYIPQFGPDSGAEARAAEILHATARDERSAGAASGADIEAVREGLTSGQPGPVAPVRDLSELATDGPVDYRGRTIHPMSFDPREVAADPVRFQYKAGGDDEGVTARLRGVEAWDATASGKVIVFEDHDGGLVIADGHQRRALALRMDQKGFEAKLDGYLFRAADGWKAPEVRVVAALKNIREGQGSPLDAAKVFREAPEYLGDRSLPVSGDFIAQGRGLAQLSDEAFGATVNKVIPERYAAEIGNLASTRPDLHMGMVRLFKAAEPANGDEARALVIEALQDDWLKHEPEQADLFGYDGSQSALIARAKLAASVKRTLAADSKLFAGLIKHADTIEAGGNALARDANEARLALDRTALEMTAKLALRSGPIGEAMAAAVERVAKGEAPGVAARSVLKRVREAVEAGERFDDARAADINPSPPSEQAQALVDGFDEPVGDGAKAQGVEAAEDAGQSGLFDDLPEMTQHQQAFDALKDCVPL